MYIYCKKQCPLEHLWAYYDSEDLFPCYRTFQSYYGKLRNQIHEIIHILAQQCVVLDSSILLPDLLPENQTIHKRLELLFTLLDSLIEIIHRKNIYGVILQEERYTFLHGFIFQKAGVILLDSS
jgi:hypothetical protein